MADSNQWRQRNRAQQYKEEFTRDTEEGSEKNQATESNRAYTKVKESIRFIRFISVILNIKAISFLSHWRC